MIRFALGLTEIFFKNTAALENLVCYWVHRRKVNCLPHWSSFTVRGMC